MAAPPDPSPGGTLRSGAPGGQGPGGPTSLAATLAGLPATPVPPLDLTGTLYAPEASSDAAAPGAVTATLAGDGRTTVLPRRPRAGAAAPEKRARFDRVRLLGEGAMGHVELARDNDIRRTVAVKRLHSDGQSEDALLRFADEVRIVGQLEHPSIVPVYDVGRDDAGQVYLVMKHLNGETMEQVIEKLRARDPAYLAQYSIEHRVHLFLGVVDAIRYAHARGVIHRDIKPANIMIGPYGEVTVLDWGIAKPIRRGDSSQGVEPLERTLVDTHDKRLNETQLGALAGTPLYMSPEQAAGRNDELDERSDVYTLCVVLYEWLSLLHPLKDKKTVTEVLAAVISGEVERSGAGTAAIMAGASPTWINLIGKGLRRDPAERFQSAESLERAIRDVLDGKVKVECHATLTKRVVYEALHWTDRHPLAYLILFHAAAVGVALGVLYGIYRLVTALI
jgi:serine/threonine-protein kinase